MGPTPRASLIRLVPTIAGAALRVFASSSLTTLFARVFGRFGFADHPLVRRRHLGVGQAFVLTTIRHTVRRKSVCCGRSHIVEQHPGEGLEDARGSEADDRGGYKTNADRRGSRERTKADAKDSPRASSPLGFLSLQRGESLEVLGEPTRLASEPHEKLSEVRVPHEEPRSVRFESQCGAALLDDLSCRSAINPHFSKKSFLRSQNPLELYPTCRVQPFPQLPTRLELEVLLCGLPICLFGEGSHDFAEIGEVAAGFPQREDMNLLSMPRERFKLRPVNQYR